MELKTIKGFYNEKGNVSAKARTSLKDQARARVLYALQNDEMLAGSIVNADGGVSIPLCLNEKGETVYAHFDMTVSTKDPLVKTEKKKASKKAEPTEMNDIVLF